MKFGYGLFAGVIILFCVVTACSKQPVAPLTSNQTSLFSQAELKETERMLNKNHTKRYDYRVIQVQKRKDGGRNLVVTKKDEVSGLLLMRNKKLLKPLGGNFFDDGQSNLVHFGGKNKNFSFTGTPGGQIILAIDGNRDGIVNTVIGDAGENIYWVLSDDIKSLLPCLSASGRGINDGAIECTKPYLPETPDEGGASSGGGFGTMGGLIPGPPVTKPDCSQKSPLDRVSQQRNLAEQSRNYARTAFNEADRERRNGNERLAQAWEKYGEAELAVELAAHTASTLPEDASQEERDRAVDEVYDTMSAADQAFEDVQDASIDETGTYLPPFGEEGEFRDPRCDRETSSSQGLGFMDLCAQQAGEARGGSPTGSGIAPDLLDCYRQMGSPLHNRTGGRCALGPGQAGGQSVICIGTGSVADCVHAGHSLEECNRAHGIDSGETTPGGSLGEGSTDNPLVPSTPGDSGTNYLDTIPIGGIIAILCQAGCPGGIGGF